MQAQHPRQITIEHVALDTKPRDRRADRRGRVAQARGTRDEWMNGSWYHVNVADAVAAVRFPSTRIVEHDVLIGNAHNGGDGKPAGLLGGCSAPAAAAVTFARRDQLFGGAT